MLHPAHKVRFASLPSGCTGPKSSPILSCLEGKVELLLCYLLVTLSSISKTELQKATLRQSLKMLFLSGFAIVDQKMTTERAIKACVYACVRACAVDKDVNQLPSRKLSLDSVITSSPAFLSPEKCLKVEKISYILTTD